MSDGWFFVVFFLIIAVFAFTVGRSDGIFTDFLAPTSTTATVGESVSTVKSRGPILTPVPSPERNVDSVAPEEFEITTDGSYEKRLKRQEEYELLRLLNELENPSS